MNGVATEWARRPLDERLRIIRQFRHSLAEQPQQFIDAIRMPFRSSAIETLSAEIMPLADACRFLETSARKILRTRRLGWRGRPMWLWGVRSEIRRVPLGTVLIIGPANYPLMLPGIQIVQAIAAGNHVVFKPAPGAANVAEIFKKFLAEAGLPADVFTVIDESPAALEAWWPRVDKVVITGSESTGRNVMNRAAEFGLPSTMELSGCDAALVLPGADLHRVAACIRFGLEFNGSFSCIAPRRLLVHESVADSLLPLLMKSLGDVQPVRLNETTSRRLHEAVDCATTAGARVMMNGENATGTTPVLIDNATTQMRCLEQDIAAPLLSVYRMPDVDSMIRAVAGSSFRLGATVFGPIAEARRVAEDLPVGSVVINDLIVPTADPRLPFGGVGRSGFGVTRGSEGLLEMTRTQVVSVRRGGVLFHLQKQTASTESLLKAQLTFQHGRTVKHRVRGILQTIRAARRA